MIFSFLILIMTVLATFFEYESFEVGLVLFMYFLAIRFYYAIYGVFVGTKILIFMYDVPLNAMWQVRACETIGAIAIYSLGYENSFFFMLPFLIIAFFMDLTISLISKGIISIGTPEIEDDEENE